MKRPRSIYDQLCFPIPPARIDRTLAEAPLLPAVAATYLGEIRRWRDAVMTALATADPAIARIENLTPRARARLAVLLDTLWDAKTQHWASESGYDLTPFPLSGQKPIVADPMQAVLDVLHWRAAVVNFLTDVWDVLGTPELEIGECAAIGTFIRPALLEGRCVYCLTEYEPRLVDPDDHGCIMVGHTHAS